MSRPLESRVKDVYAGLTAHERVMLRLRWFKDDREEDPELERSTPHNHLDQVNREMAFANAIDENVSWYAELTYAQTDILCSRYAAVQVFDLWHYNVSRVKAKLDGSSLSPALEEALRPLLGEAPGIGEDGEADRLRQEYLDGVIEGLRDVWGEILAVDEAIAWGAVRFDGEEPIHPETRRLLDDTRGRLEELARELEGLLQPVDLPDEPAADVLEGLKGKANHASNNYPWP